MYIHHSQVDKNMQVIHAVLWIRIGFADPDPAFYLIADSDPVPDPGSQTNANICIQIWIRILVRL
jgi:hypothetical protein